MSKLLETDSLKRYLAWDTSTSTGIISAFEVKENRFRSVAEWSLSLETSRHSERLLWGVDTVLQSAGWDLSQISGIAVGVGPGSFTGIRIGLTTAKILAKTLHVDLIPISSLEILKHEALKMQLSSTLVIACNDATKGEWFSLMGSTEEVLPPEELGAKIQAELQKHPELRWLAVGQSIERYPDFWNALPQEMRIRIENAELHRVQPRALSELALEAIRQGDFKAPHQIHPRYLRASEAEVKLKKGLLKSSPTHNRSDNA